MPDAATVALHTLGECRIVVAHAGGTTTLTPASDRLFTLTLLLAADPGRAIPRAHVAAWLWPDLPAAASRHALRQLLYRLRKLGVTVGGDDAHLALAPHLVAQPATAPHDDAPRGGPCLPGWHPSGEALRAWVDRYRATVEGHARATLARALAAALLELDPRHPLARDTVPHANAVRETTRPAHDLPCVGRDDVHHALRARAIAAHAGHGSTVVLAAPSGAGTTRVLEEFAATARALGLSVAIAPDRSPTPASVARALATVVRALLDRPGALGCAPNTLHTLRRFAATPVLPTGDATVRRLGAAVGELARAVAAERPLFLAVDARCDTPPERTLAAAITRALDGAAVLAVVVAPPAALGALGAPGSAAHVVPLPPLANDAAATLAAATARARGRAISNDDRAWCVTMARGRPGDVIALAEACAARPGTRILPAALAARLRDRIAALPPRTREVAALCALLGDTDTADRAAHALGRRPAAIGAALFELRRADVPGIPGAGDRDPLHHAAIRIVGSTALATFDAAERATLRARAAAARQAAEPERDSSPTPSASMRPSMSAWPGSPL